MTGKPTDMASLARSAREERARAEVAALDKVRKPRARGRTEQIGVRITPEHRAKLERLAESTGKSFGRLFEDAIDMLEKIEQAKGR